MHILPEPSADCTCLYANIYQLMQSKLLLSAIELSIFDALVKPKTAKDIARKLSTHQGSTKACLDALVSCGFVEKKQGIYQNSPVTRAFLESGSPTYIGDFLSGLAQMMLGTIDSLPDILQHGPKGPADDKSPYDAQLWAQMADPMARYSLSGKAQQIAGIISRLPEFSSFSSLLDLGGSAGAFAMTLVAEHPGMKAVVFDLPAVVEVAEKTIRKYGFQDRIKVLGGDFINGSIGGDYDLIWTSTALNFCKADLNIVIEKVLGALNPGGVFACLQDGLIHEGTQPKEIVLPMLYWALMGNDIRFEQGEIANVMLQTGFRSVHSQTIMTTDGPLDLDIGRK